MGNKKWQSEAESYLRKILDVLEMYEAVVSIEQHSNKVECFEIFKKAYEAGFCALRYRIPSSRY